jgi:hypothetical protein
MTLEDTIKEKYIYDSTTEIVTNKKSGKAVGYERTNNAVAGKSYLVVDIWHNKKTHRISVHRLAWLFVHGSFANEIDHINRDKQDNRISNLREATRTQNQANLFKTNKSGFKGVHMRPSGTFYAHIGNNGKQHYIGSYKTANEAAIAYNKKAIELFGEFAALNEVA